MSEVKLGGRLFSVVNFDAITVRNEHYVMREIAGSELDTVLPAPGEEDTAYMLRLHARVIASLRLPELLAGYLLPAGKLETDWTEAMAAETARLIAGLTTPEDRAEVHRLGLSVVMDFFRVGLASMQTFQNALDGLASPTPARMSSGAAAH